MNFDELMVFYLIKTDESLISAPIAFMTPFHVPPTLSVDSF